MGRMYNAYFHLIARKSSPIRFSPLLLSVTIAMCVDRGDRRQDSTCICIRSNHSRSIYLFQTLRSL